MKRLLSKGVAAAVVGALACVASGCEELNDSRIPAMPVSINLLTTGIWNSYGVAAYGQYRNFILTSTIHEPANFSFRADSHTGYGGVLLIYGQNPFSLEVGPLAYDLSCPYERKPDIRVKVDSKTFEAYCVVCGSRYNVTERGGSPIAGPSLTDHYQMKMYQCLPPADGSGGYVIADSY